MPYDSIAISSGHSKYVRGASCPPPGLDEVDEARKVVERLANELESRGVDVEFFHDDESKTQDENLKRITDWHNNQSRDLDISVHFNAHSGGSDKPYGCEVLYITQGKLAADLSEAIASASGLINRGAKENSNLYFLNNTEMPAVLLEICFVDSYADADIYRKHFEAICAEMADLLGGTEIDEEEVIELPPPGEIDIAPRPIRPPDLGPPTPRPILPSRPPAEIPRVDIQITGNVVLIINGEEMGE
jgi:N-acetylmuramoyl-L-alanine amidase